MELRTSEDFAVDLESCSLGALSNEELRQVREVVERSGLVVARRQFLTRDAHVELALRLGPIDEYDTRVPNTSPTPYVARTPGTRVVVEAEETGRNEEPTEEDTLRWRLDGSFKADPVCFSTEAAIEVSSGPWATAFLNLQLAFERLGSRERESAERVEVWHSAVYAKARAGEVDVAVPDDPHELPGAVHPLVWAHPVTGRKGLYIGENAVAVEGMGSDDGRELLNGYLSDASQSENVCLHRWQTGDVVLWDSRFVAHRRMPPVGSTSATIRHISVLSGTR